MRRAKDLFPRIVDLANLGKAFTAAGRGKRDRREVAQFEHHLETRLWDIRRALDAGTYRWGAYRRFRIRDPKPREIRAPPFRDRVVHHAIFHVLDPIVRRRLIADTYACIPGRGAHRAVARFAAFARARAGAGYVLQGDVKSYFASVDHAVLGRLLARLIGDRRLRALLDALIAHGAEAPAQGMPIGNLTSQLFANLYLDPLDHYVKETLRVRHYLRYMDDFVLLLDDRAEARARLAQVESFLADRLALRLNPRRVTIAPLAAPHDVLGYVRSSAGDGIRWRVRRRSVRRLWRRLPVLQARLDAGEVAWGSVRASLASWFGLACRADAFRLSRAIFSARDVRHLGKRLLVRTLVPECARAAERGRYGRGDGPVQ